jgi:PadR family transcriptional regulator, regulatory protein PadR
MNLRGSLPALVLETLRPGPRHGYDIAQQIKNQSEGVLDFQEGTLYPALHTLERDGLVTSFHEIYNGRKRRYYQLTEAGSVQLSNAKAEWQRYAQAIGGILGGKA